MELFTQGFVGVVFFVAAIAVFATGGVLGDALGRWYRMRSR